MLILRWMQVINVDSSTGFTNSLMGEFKVAGQFVYFNALRLGQSVFLRVDLGGLNDQIVNTPGIVQFFSSGENIVFTRPATLNDLTEIVSIAGSTDSKPKVVSSFPALMNVVGPQRNYVIYPVWKTKLSVNSTDPELFISNLDESAARSTGIVGYLAKLIQNEVALPWIYMRIGRGNDVISYGFINTFSSVESFALNTVNLNKISLPALESATFSKDGNYLYGMNNKNLVKVDLKQGSFAEICANQGSIQQFRIGDSGRVYFFNSDDIKTQIYIYDATGGCKKINEALVSVFSAATLLIAPDERQAILTSGSGQFIGPGNQNSNYWIPLNGKPIVKILTTELEKSLTYKIQFLQDSKSVMYFFMDQQSTDYSQTFKMSVWKVPEF